MNVTDTGPSSLQIPAPVVSYRPGCSPCFVLGSYVEKDLESPTVALALARAT